MAIGSSIRFVELRNEQVKQLPGFQKHHKVPTGTSDYEQKMVAGLAEPILDEDLQETFSALRKAYGLKRKEISVDGPFEGGGIVTTPFFNYEIKVEIDEEHPSRVIFSRSITNISEFSRVVAGPFDDVFGKRFSILFVDTEAELDLESVVDTIEDAESDSVKVDYDKDLTWCEIQVLGSTATVVVQADMIRVESVRETTPKELLELFTDIQQDFIATLQWDGKAF
jgi:hypothetical protein